jgi:eukaryotic-like serine/threonine-protein kinase
MNEYRRTLATSYSEQADVELELGHAPAAATLYQRAIVLLGQLDKHDEHDTEYNLALGALTASMQGEAMRRSGELSAAATRIDQARLVEERLVKQNPGNAYFRWILGTIYAALAGVRADEQQPSAALRLYDQALGIADEMNRADPTHKDYALLLCGSLQGVERTAMDRGDGERAAAAHQRRCDAARAFVERDPEDARFKRMACR